MILKLDIITYPSYCQTCQLALYIKYILRKVLKDVCWLVLSRPYILLKQLKKGSKELAIA